MYTEMSAQIEQITEWIFFYMDDIFMCCVLIGALGQCYINYYIFDLGEESFILPIPIWYVIVT